MLNRIPGRPGRAYDLSRPTIHDPRPPERPFRYMNAMMRSLLRTTPIGAFDTIVTAGSDIASAGTINLTTATGALVDITGTTTISTVTLATGDLRLCRAAAAFQLTASSSLIVNGSTSVNYTTVAGDLLLFEGYASSVVRVWVIGLGNGPAAHVETGTWTPTLAFGGAAVGLTYTTQTGDYVRVGDVLYYNFHIVLSNKGSSTGAAVVSGLPYTPNNDSGVGMFVSIANITLPNATHDFTGTGSSGLKCRTYSTTAATDLTNSAFTNTTNIYGAGYVQL